MRTIIQRVTNAELCIEGLNYAAIGKGLLVFVGIEETDNQEDIDWLCKKILNLRIFNDHNGIMNLSVSEINGEILLVSQFTLHASTKKGNRPSYIRAAKPDIAIPLYDQFIQTIKNSTIVVKTGLFGADMKITLLNDGPVTIYMDSKNKE